MKLKINNLTDIKSAARSFVEAMNGHTVFAFYGSMGAGKTTFIKAVCEELGVTETITSPTFAIINEYRTGDDGVIYHFDFYRINKPEEAFDFGYEDYFYSGNICFVEWPELIEELLPGNTLKISICVEEDGARAVETM